MIEKTYVCNICRDKYFESKDVDRFISGIFFSTDRGTNRLEIKLCCECDKHICIKCFDELKKLDKPVYERE